ncbi:MAG: methylated-DNA--[protein]-cysteine S-methyltransferase [Bdellovibrionia bacterium]
MSSVQLMMNSVIGPLFVVASERGLLGIYWKQQPAHLVHSLKSRSPEVQILARAQSQLDEYLRADRKRFDLPLDVQGTEFQKKVWAALTEIPYGKTVSYQELANQIENKNAVRAVGTANGRNPLCIVIPCHRVIASNGTLGGYSGGLEIKAKLLKLEQA